MFEFDNSYARLPAVFFERVDPVAVEKAALVKVNHALGNRLDLNLDLLEENTAADLFSGNDLFVGSEPIAMAYAGHQFAGWVPQLGDGRAVLLGEVLDLDGVRHDIQLKGSGPTPFSRSGDGRAWLGPVLREYVVSEAMAALNIPTTRALAVVTTGENIYREDVLPGAILTRVSTSHIRVGTFQYFAARNDVASLKTLADYVIERHFPMLKDQENPYLGLLECMVSRQVSLISQWMGVGFIHGVMNTDNVLISGSTIDYGPCAFMDQYDPQTVFSFIDRRGRYAYGNQPSIGLQNCAYFASSLLPLLGEDENEAIKYAEQVLDSFPAKYEAAWAAELGAKIGLMNIQDDGDEELGQTLLQLMEKHKVDFTVAFRKLSHLGMTASSNDDLLIAMFNEDLAFQDWLGAWRKRLGKEDQSDRDRQKAMKAKNPAIIPRNHQVENMISAAVEGDYQPFENLLEAVTNPFEERSEFDRYQYPPVAINPHYRTFCGT